MRSDIQAHVDRLNQQIAQLTEQHQYKEAIVPATSILDFVRQSLGEQSTLFAESLNTLAALYYNMGEYSKAEPLLEQALAISRAVLGEQHPDVATSLNNLAVLYEEMGEYSKAEPLFEQALAISRAALGEQHPDTAGSLNNLALLYQNMREYSKAEPLYQQALAIRRAVLGEQHPDVATSLNNLALLYRNMGEYGKAKPLLEQALAIRRAALGEQHPDTAGSLNNLALLYRNMGEYSKAEPLLEQALAIRRTALGEQHPDIAQSLNSLALLYNDMGEYSKAEPLYQQALAIRHTALGEQHPDVAQSLNNLAALYNDMGEYSKAEPLLEQALAIRRAVLGEQHPDVAVLLSNLADVLVALGRETEAFSLLQQALAIEDQMIGQIFSFGSDRRRMAYLATAQGNFASFLSLVLQFFPSSQVQVQAAMDVVLRRRGIAAEALAAQRDALLGGRYPALAPALEQLKALRTQIVQKTLAGPGAESTEAYQQRLNEWNAQKEQLEADQARHLPEMTLDQQMQKVNRQAIASQLPHDALLVEFVRFSLFDFHAVPARGEPRWKPAYYVAFVLSGNNPNQVHLIDLDEAERIDGLIADFRAALTGEREDAIPAEDSLSSRSFAADLSASLSESEEERKRDLLPDDGVPDEVHADLAGKQLREAIFDPLLPDLYECRHLFLAPDGNLSRLPFETLPTEDVKRLIDHYQISYVSVGRDLLRFTAASGRQTHEAVVLADPDFDLAGSSTASTVEVPAPTGRRSAELANHLLTFERLRGTRQEGEQIAQALRAQALFDKQAMVGSLKALRSPRILHLATHGFFLPDQQRNPNKEPSSLASEQLSMTSNGGMTASDRLTRLMGQYLENPLLRSGLAFAGANTWNRGGTLPPEAEDGLLTAEDVSSLDLLDTELVVLSACETGLGEVQIGEGVFGLRRTFVLAGAKTLVMSLWKVPDQQTQELMEDFYRRLLASQPRAEALREAQLALKEKYPHPYYWGAFICQGNPGPLS